MNIYLLNKIRKIFKSIGKYEYKILDKITLLENKKVIIKDKDFNSLENKFNFPKKIAITICFHFKKNKIKNLVNSCSSIENFKFFKEVLIITNEINKNEMKLLQSKITKKFSNIKIIQIKDIPDPNLLPWFCFNVLKKKYKDKTFSHFLYLEDDILINTRNISYWIQARKLLKKYNLIPAFLRCEIYNKKLFSVDNIERIKLKLLPKIQSETKKNGFVNLRYPYHASSLMDRKLMKEYLSSDLISIDFGFHHKIMKSLYPLKELANVIIGYINVPKGLHNRFFLPFKGKNLIPNYCIINHMDNNYVNSKKEKFGKIDIKNLIISD